MARTKGALNKRTLEVQALAEALVERGLSPLEVMLKTMEKAWDEGNTVLACSVAKDAAPYMHPRLNAVEHSGEIVASKVIRSPAPSPTPSSWAKDHIPAHLRPTEH